MQVDPTQPTDKEANKFVIACAIDPLTKKPYPLVVNPVTGELVTSGGGGSGDLSKKTDQYWVSDLYGSDTTGDGGVNKPFKTIQKAVDVIATIVPARNFEVIICISIYSGGPTVEIPVGLDISLINFTGSPFSVPLWIDLRLNGFTLTRVTGITLNTITELDSDSKILLIKEGDVGHVQPATPTALYVISEDAYIPDAANFIVQVASFDGTYRTGGSGGITLATVGQPLTDNELTTKKYVDDKTKRNVGKYWVSGEFGDNTNGNGGINNPYKTIQKALTEGFAIYDYIEVIFDSTTVAETCTVPSVKQLSLVGSGFTMGSVSIANKFHVELDDDTWLFTSNVRFSEIEFIGTGSPANVVINNCTVDALTNDSNIIFYPHSTIFLVTPTIVDFGTWFDNANMHFANRNLKDILDPVDEQDAMTKLYAENNFSTITHDHADVIHNNVAGEISGITNKGTPVIGDVLLIEDSENAGNKKSILIGALPSQPDSTAIHKTTAAEISAMVDKATPVNADVFLIEDSATTPVAFLKKKVSWTNLKATMKTYMDSLYATLSHNHATGNGGAIATDQIAKFGDGGVTNYAELQTTGKYRAYGTGRFKRHIYVSAQNAYTGSGWTFDSQTYGATTLAVITQTERSFLFRGFDDGTRQCIVWNIALPSDYVAGTDFEVCLGWMASAITGNVLWKLASSRAEDNTTYNILPIYQNLLASAPATQWHRKTSTFTVTGTNYKPGDCISLVIMRVASDGTDTMIGNANVAGMMMNYIADKLGGDV